jgi:hypothetical protein
MSVWALKYFCRSVPYFLLIGPSKNIRLYFIQSYTKTGKNIKRVGSSVEIKNMWNVDMIKKNQNSIY